MKPPNKHRARGITQSPVWQTLYPIGLWTGRRRRERAVTAALRSSERSSTDIFVHLPILLTTSIANRCY